PKNNITREKSEVAGEKGASASAAPASALAKSSAKPVAKASGKSRKGQLRVPAALTGIFAAPAMMEFLGIVPSPDETLILDSLIAGVILSGMLVVAAWYLLRTSRRALVYSRRQGRGADHAILS